MSRVKRFVGKSDPFRPILGAIGIPLGQSRFETVATLNIKPTLHEAVPRWRPAIVAGLLSVLFALGLYSFFDNDWFFVGRVEVQGLYILTQSEVERATGAVGYNVYFLDPSRVELAVRKLPEIKSANVMLGVPNLVLVQIQERVPKILWSKGDEAYWVDEDGIAFRARYPNAELLTVRDFDVTGLKAGEHVTPVAFKAVRAVRTAWQSPPKNFEWTRSNGLTTTDEHGWKIILGDANDMELKIIKLRALTSQLVAQGARIKFIDLGKGDPFYQ